MRAHLVEVGALERPVAVDVRVDELLHAAALQAARSRPRASICVRLGPAGDGHVAVAHVDRDHDPVLPGARAACRGSRCPCRRPCRPPRARRPPRAPRAPTRASAGRRRTAPARRARWRSGAGGRGSPAGPRARRRGPPRAASCAPGLDRTTRRVERIVLRRRSRFAKSPCSSRTALPSRMSTAGRRITAARLRPPSPQIAREVAEQPQAVRASTSRGGTGRRRRGSRSTALRELGCRTWPCRARRLGRPVRARTSARGRTAHGSGSPSAEA